MMAVEYFTFPGNGEAVRAVFNGVATISGSTMMGGAMQAAALFGFLVTLAVAVFKLDLKDNFSYLFVVLFCWMGMMVPKTTVLITESGGYGYTGRQYTVGNVPVGLAYMGYFVSSFGQSITRKAEQVNHLPDDLNYSRTGMLFGTRLMENIREARIPDAQLTQDWALFMHQCSFFDMNLYHFYNVQDLAQSADILATLTHTNQALFTNVSQIASRRGNMLQYNGKSKTMTCNEAAKELKDRTRFYSKNYLPGYIADRVFAGLGTNSAGINRVNALATLGNSSFQYLLDNARFDTLKNIEQAAMVEVIRQAGIINGQRNRNPAAVQQAFAQVQARNQYIAAQKTGSSMASWNLPLIRSAAEAILIGLFPFVMILAMLGGIMAFRLLSFYMMSMLWIQLWAPVASIINMIMTMNAKRLFSVEAANGVITPGTGDTLLMAAADAQAAAGAAMWLIPVIAGALAMGGRSLMNGMMGMTSSAKSTGEAAGSQVGSGNYSAGNMNYNNSNANKHSLNPVYTDPQMMTAQSAAGTSWRNMATGDSRAQMRNSSFGVSSQSQISQSESYSKAADRAETSAQQWQASFRESVSQGNANRLAFATNYGMDRSASEGYGMGLDAAESRKLSYVIDQGKKIAQKFGVTNTSAVISAIAAGLGISGNTGSSTKAQNIKNALGAKGDLGWSGKSQNTDQMVAEIGESIEAGKRQGISFDSNFTDKVSQSEAYKVALNSGNSLAQTAEANFSKAREAAHMSAESYQEAQSYREMAARTYGNGITIAQDNTNALVQDNPELTMSELNAGQGGTYNAAIRAGVNSQDRLKAAAENSGWRPNDLSPEDRPQNNTQAAYKHFSDKVSSGAGAAFGDVQTQAHQAGIIPDGINAAINARGENLKQEYANKSGKVEGDINQGRNSHRQEVGRLATHAKNAQDETNGVTMRINTHALPWNSFGERYDNAMKDVREGKGYIGSGSDQAAAHLGNPALASEFDLPIPQRPGNSKSSGSAVFRPKE
ncbi:conjugal transfer protein TraG N-terminal domain-containing protein [Neisseria gonorrhoeae]|uniref:conjugal transfer protein TraG N-terminal domain-containing protein n=1 Tax=Neisseria gonorrhoeae TaxID=485 RepID=UPI001BFD433C|nr:conjugal transfer protein TraG N-terminal domain-containing protein [Neisseria gonorrhoeae]MBT8022149.1 conjugal transfer protein TraG N-terminal domain-containing protein [Neisseria gonorrhoeae]MBT8028460.1 conjugal transfer protein TraG N-terminal domain-containing protein [Neisseria gonorrhoeae]MCK2161316.1 conjugal transfer protein TraG N-terminal domain-containing protein [Neisseria gonorrhoeae]MCK2206439.1 conjugal transfer protein TraG N-terminal domain-containing protein [Neisseria g